MSPFYGFGGFQIINVLSTLMFLLVFGIIIGRIFAGIRQWGKDEQSPRLTVDAQVIAKRTNVSRHHHGTGVHAHTTRSTTYYATFQFDSGDRLELKLRGQEYGLIVEGDKGKLTFQGTRFLGFERT